MRALPAAEDNLVWVLECVETGVAAVVDGPDAEALIGLWDAGEVRPVAIWNTHTHGDHVGINRDLQRRGRLAGLQVVGPAEGDVPGRTVGVSGDGGHGGPPHDGVGPPHDGVGPPHEMVRLGALTARVMRTEGHVDGHVSYVVGEDSDDPVLFCGDTLFAGGCGYLFDGPPAKMFDSLLRLAALPAGTRVCCAHEYTQDNLRFAWSVEPDNAALAERIERVWATRAAGRTTLPSTVGEERATNPFLRPGSPAIVAAAAASGADVSTPERVFAATRRLKDSKAYRARPEPSTNAAT